MSLDLCFGGGGSLSIKIEFCWGVGCFYFEFLGDYFLLRGILKFFFKFFFFFFVLWWKFTNICLTFTHSFTQFFFVYLGKCKCWTVCFFCFWAKTKS